MDQIRRSIKLKAKTTPLLPSKHSSPSTTKVSKPSASPQRRKDHISIKLGQIEAKFVRVKKQLKQLGIVNLELKDLVSSRISLASESSNLYLVHSHSPL
jgi:hypothetical protein